MKKYKMTKWDAGQDLVKSFDYLTEIEKDLRNGGFEKETIVVRKAMALIGKAFNKLKTHSFLLPENFE